ncbi:MAG: hypothetical protein Q9227_006035 [Pyrenula ochraceoflavens]
MPRTAGPVWSLESPAACSIKRDGGDEAEDDTMSEPTGALANSEDFTPDILIRTLTGVYVVAAAALDTQCQTGNWISKRLVDELRLSSRIRQEPAPERAITATGEVVESCGIIHIDWKLASSGTRVLHGDFFVQATARHWDVILGQDFINKEKLFSPQSYRLLAPLAMHQKISDSDKAAVAALEARQQQEKRELEARRLAAQQQRSPHQSYSQQNANAWQLQQYPR